MTLLLDTNIIMDILTMREGYEDSLRVMKLCEVKMISGVVSATTVTDVIYILRKYMPTEDARKAVQTLLSVVDVVGTLKNDILTAFTSNVPDYEDAIQESCAARINADYIVTRSTRHFHNSKVPVLLPGDIPGLLT